MKFNKITKVSQPIVIMVIVIVTVLITLWMFVSGQQKSDNSKKHDFDSSKNTESKQGPESKNADDHQEEEGHDEEGEIELTTQQLVEHGIKIESTQLGEVQQTTNLPAKLMVNTDKQAHISPNFAGHVEQVNVALGQDVVKGQVLAVLSVPDLIDQQANLKMAQASLDLAQQDLQRERTMWSQGISAKQDLQRAENAYRQAQISVQSTKSRLQALGATSGSNGQFTIRSPISGVISQKDIVVGENVQLADRIFTIEQLKDLWLEFVLPANQANEIRAQQSIQFKSIQSGQVYTAIVQTLTSQADTQTGRLMVRAKVQSQANELRPNLMVNVELQQANSLNALRVSKNAIQQIKGKPSVFILAEQKDGKVHFKAQAVELGLTSSDGKWVEIKSGLKQDQKYAGQGSFLMKSELEKGEADHAH